jgi:hypothetical protein
MDARIAYGLAAAAGVGVVLLLLPRTAMADPIAQTLLAGAAPFAGLNESQREHAIEAALLARQVPSVLHDYVPIATTIPGHTATFYALPDYLGVGTDVAWLRTPMYPGTAQRVADAWGAALPTRKMVDMIYQQAGVKAGFTGFTPGPGEHRSDTKYYLLSNADAERKIAGRAGLRAGHKKDIVVGNLLARFPDTVQIYGGWYASGQRVQPPSGSAHNNRYVDYSHGVRLVKDYVDVDGQRMTLAQVLADPALSALLSDEGVIQASGMRYST